MEAGTKGSRPKARFPLGDPQQWLASWWSAGIWPKFGGDWRGRLRRISIVFFERSTSKNKRWGMGVRGDTNKTKVSVAQLEKKTKVDECKETNQ
jgi:hypothetical protein